MIELTPPAPDSISAGGLARYLSPDNLPDLSFDCRKRLRVIGGRHGSVHVHGESLVRHQMGRAAAEPAIDIYHSTAMQPAREVLGRSTRILIKPAMEICASDASRLWLRRVTITIVHKRIIFMASIPAWNPKFWAAASLSCRVSASGACGPGQAWARRASRKR